MDEEQRRASVWEQRKLAAMSRIQRVAMELFHRHGYANVTVERVAAAAGTSPSSIYRYFGTKEALVLYDEYDRDLQRLLETEGEAHTIEPHELVAAARIVTPALIESMITDQFEERIRRRLTFAREVPALAEAMTKRNQQLEHNLRTVLAARTGRSTTDLGIWMVAAAAAWISFAALHHWAERDFPESLTTVYTRTIDDILTYAETQFPN